jgi:CemA family
MINSIYRDKIYPLLLAAYQWYLRTPERSLDEAYKAALKIKTIENEHFHGNKINAESTRYSRSVMDYFEADLKKLLKEIRMRLTEFKFSRFILNESNQTKAKRFGIDYPQASLILEKLKFIDEVIAQYNTSDEEINSNQLIIPDQTIITLETPKKQTKKQNLLLNNNRDNQPRGKTNTTGILPRSIFNTITRLQVELDPNAEQDIVQNFRDTQKRTIISVRFILLLIIVPILTHQISKALVIGPIFDNYFAKNSEEMALFLNYEMEEEALTELQRFEERIKFNALLENTVELSNKQIEEQLKEKAIEIAEEFRLESANAIKNVFADILSAGTFIWLLLTSKREIAVIKDFFDHIVYGLSDSAKAFIIILFTDIFVGFHSPHGWEVILEGISRHWGLPANHDFIFLFIATFPVILDTIFKYWIFRYLNRISPSAVATYRNMNE